MIFMDRKTYGIMIKPAGSDCNAQCAYCYYKNKSSSLRDDKHRMSYDILELVTKQIILIHGEKATIEFAWHGGEPTIAGIEFYKTALGYQKKYGNGRQISNTLQTNATLLNDEWCEFFVKNNFLLGVSIDGEKQHHDKYRKDYQGNSIFEKTMNGISLLKKHGVKFNTLTTINAYNSKYPKEVYGFLRNISDFMQFLPVVESVPTTYERNIDQNLSEPTGLYKRQSESKLTNFSVSANQYGEFLCGIFDEWKRLDFGKKFVQIFEATMGNMLKKQAGICVHEALCGHCASIERDGSVYSCDRYTFPKYKIGKISETPLENIMEKNRTFGMHKTYGLSDACFKCDYITLCFGGCPKDRVAKNHQNHLCEGYKIFFNHFQTNIAL